MNERKKGLVQLLAAASFGSCMVTLFTYGLVILPALLASVVIYVLTLDIGN